NGTPVVKYGFTLKQWFVNRGSKLDNYSNTVSWCNSLGYRVPKVKDLTNASRDWYYNPISIGASPSSSSRYYMRHIGSGFFTEWGKMDDYSGVGFINSWYWTSDPDGSAQFFVGTYYGHVDSLYTHYGIHGLCSHP
ncbi:hypothetical protein J3T94_05210, partial [Gilliamella sp. B3372]